MPQLFFFFFFAPFSPQFLPPCTHHSRLSPRRGSSAPCPTAQRPLATGGSSPPILGHAGDREPREGSAASPVLWAQPGQPTGKWSKAREGWRPLRRRATPSASGRRKEGEEEGGRREGGEGRRAAPHNPAEPGDQRAARRRAARTRRGSGEASERRWESEARSGRSRTRSGRAGSAAGERVTLSHHGCHQATVPTPGPVATRGAQATDFRVRMPPQ